MDQKVILTRVPFITLLKLGLIGTTFSALLLLLLMAALHLFVTFPPDPYADAPRAVKVVMWLLYLVIGPAAGGLLFSLSCWIGVSVLSRLRLIRLTAVIHKDDAPRT